MNHPTRMLPAIALAAAIGTAQAPESLDPQALATDLVVPLHTRPADPIGGAYGVWAAGPSWKARFDGDFTFYPVLGPAAPAHLPFQWRTESVHAGEAPLPLTPAAMRWTDCRFERTLGSVVEAYDVRRDGVEQTFTLREPPAAAGDVVITGAITTPLVCEPAPPAHRELCFADRGAPIVRYGEAIAFDADGRTTRVGTSWDGSRIRLTVPASFVATAAFPVVVDPLITAAQLASGLPGQPERPAITAHPAANGKMVVAWSRYATAGDRDAYALVVSRDFSSGTWLYTDLQTSWASHEIDATWIGSGSLWVVSQRRNFGANQNHARLYLHGLGNNVANSGTTLFPSAPAGFEDFAPVLGGSRSGAYGLLVVNRVHTATGAKGVAGVRIHAPSQSLGSNASFTAGFLEPLEHARVTPLTDGGSGWVVAMHGSSGVRVAKVPVFGTGAIATSLLVPIWAVPVTGSAAQLAVAGTAGRYLVAYGRTDLYVNPLGPQTVWDRLHTVRFDWPNAAASPSILHESSFANYPTLVGDAFLFRIGGLEYDMETRSHWALSYLDLGGAPRVRRFGYSGASSEWDDADGLCDVAFSYDGPDGSFPVAYAVAQAGGTAIVGGEFHYPAAASVPYGISCAPAGVTVTSDRPFAGHEFFTVRLENVAPGTPCIFLLGTDPGSFDLTPLGLTGCWLNVALPALGTLSVVADGSGDAEVVFALPESPLLLDDLHSQWFWFDPTAGPVPFRSHRGVHHDPD